MLKIIQPSKNEIDALATERRVFYWSSCAEMILRKHGLTVRADNGPESTTYSVSLLGRSELPQAGFCEGPFSAAVLKGLGLHGVVATPETVSLSDHAGQPIGQLVYGRFLVKRIPGDRKEQTAEHEYIDKDSRWHAPKIALQYFPNPVHEWEILATADLEDGQRVPAVLKRGPLVISGCPFFDLFGFNHAMPALDEAFYTSHVASYQYPVERWLVDLLKTHAAERGLVLQEQPIWPAGTTAALSVRHDYDRPISMKQLMEMLAFYAETGIRATWFLIVGSKMPPREQVEAMLALGHEVAFHTVASTLEVFLAEVVAFRRATGITPAGFTCHGGIGSGGHLALTHNSWAMRAGMLYGEMIGRCRGLPHPLVSAGDGGACTQPLITQNCHYSLDLNTKPEGHQLHKLSNEIPAAMERGEHVVVMNHPDIHWNELRLLFTGLDLSKAWLATLESVAFRVRGLHA